MTYAPNMEVIRRVAATSRPRPAYHTNHAGNPYAEDDVDHRPTRFIHGECKSCGRRYPMRGLCGCCWHHVRQIDAAKEAANG